MNVALSTNVLSLCAGYAGIDMGLRLADPSTHTVCYVEREATVAALLAARFADRSLDPAPIWSDLRTFDGRPWRGVVDFITAGYPCQPFSLAGKRRGQRDPRHLFPEVARIIGEVEPEWVFLENVGGHLRLGFREVAQKLRAMGYRVAAGLFTAEEVGAPHRRERLFALAHRESGRCGELRQPSGSDRFADGCHADVEDAAWPAEQRGRRRRGISQAGDALADAGDRLIPIARRRSQGRTGTRPAGALLADAPHVYGRPRIESDASGSRLGRPGLAGNGTAVADAGLGRPPQQRDGSRSKAQRAAAVRSSLLFPPGPADLDAWRDVLEEWPEIEPAIRGELNGDTARVDRLRALGNGVVPLVAAYAYRRLRTAFEHAAIACAA